jgi:hypothetical protein
MTSCNPCNPNLGVLEGEAHRESQRVQSATGVTGVTRPTYAYDRCGTISRYINRKCRCRAYKDAWRDYYREYRDRRREGDGPD